MPRRAGRVGRRVVLGTLGAAITVAAGAAEPVLAVIRHNADGPQLLGTATLDAAGRLNIVSAVPAQADWLQQLAARVNAYPTLSVVVPPPSGSPPLSTASRTVARDDPGFPDALRQFLRAYYDIELQ